uniref:Acrosin n=1 Tax=Cyprinus carpio carpio TaxID=630221 RepID=A0A8C1AT07_CYPCA
MHINGLLNVTGVLNGLILFTDNLIISGCHIKSNEKCCGKQPLLDPPKHLRISGGLSALEGAWPWQVSIQRMSRHICGGSVINTLCFSSLIPLAGVNSRSKYGMGVQYRSVQQVILHENFSRLNYDNDVALLHLHHPLYFTKHYLNVKKHYTLQEAEVDLIDTGICNQSSWYNGHVNDNMICAGFYKGGVDTCQGDSGGPLQCFSKDMERFYLYGVTSHGEDCALPRKPGIYTRASRYTVWLREAQTRSVSAASVTDLPVFKLTSALFFSACMGLLM